MKREVNEISLAYRCHNQSLLLLSICTDSKPKDEKFIELNSEKNADTYNAVIKAEEEKTDIQGASIDMEKHVEWMNEWMNEWIDCVVKTHLSFADVSLCR